MMKPTQLCDEPIKLSKRETFLSKKSFFGSKTQNHPPIFSAKGGRKKAEKPASIEAFFNYSNAIFRKLFIASYPAFNILGIVFISALFNSLTSSSPLNNLPPIL